jgi:hypothetical protein
LNWKKTIYVSPDLPNLDFPFFWIPPTNTLDINTTSDWDIKKNLRNKRIIEHSVVFYSFLYSIPLETKYLNPKIQQGFCSCCQGI